MNRLVLTSPISSPNHLFKTRIFSGNVQEFLVDTWTDVPNTPITARWVMHGKSLATIPPRSFVPTPDFLHNNTSYVYVVPDIIDVDVTNITELQLTTCSVINIVSTNTGNVVEPDGIFHDAQHTTIDFTSLSGLHRIFLAPLSKADYVEENLVQGIYTIIGTWMVHGVVKDGEVSKNFAVNYFNNRTYVDVNHQQGESGSILYSKGHLLSVKIPDGANFVKLVAEYPVQTFNKELVQTNLTINLFNGFTSVYVEPTTESPITLIVGDWVYAYLRDNFKGKEFIFSSSPSTTPPPPSIYNNFKGYFESLQLLQSAHPLASNGDWAIVGGVTNTVAIWNNTLGAWVLVETLSSTDETTYVPSGTVLAYRVYRRDGGSWTLASTDDPSTETCELWMSLGTNVLTDGMITDGEVTNNAWNWLVIGAPLYLSLNGTITTAVPTIGDNPSETIRIVGHVRASNKIKFRGYLPGALMNVGGS